MKLIRILSVMAMVSLSLISCDKVLDKSSIDASHFNKENLAAVELISATLEVTRGQSALCEASATATGNYLEVGFAYATKEDFSDAKCVASEDPIAPTGEVDFSAVLNFAPVTKYYIKSYATVADGTTYSEDVVELTTPDIPFEEKIVGTYYAGKMEDYWEDEYTFNLVIYKDSTDGEFYAGNLDPYFEGIGATYNKGYNKCQLTLDETNSQIKIDLGSSAAIPTQGGSLVLVAFNNIDPDVATSYDDLVFTVKDGGMTLHVENAWGLTSDPSQGFNSLYYGGYDYNKK